MARITHPANRHRLKQLLADAFLLALAYYAAFRLRFLDASDGIPQRYEDMLYASIGFVIAGKLIIFGSVGLYEKWWRYFRLEDYGRVLKAAGVSTAILVLAFLLLKPFDDSLPRSVIVTDFLLTIMLISGARLTARAIVERPSRNSGPAKARGVLVVGAGSGGRWSFVSSSSTHTSALPRSASWTMIPASVGCACTASRFSAPLRRSARCSTRPVHTRW